MEINQNPTHFTRSGLELHLGKLTTYFVTVVSACAAKVLDSTPTLRHLGRSMKHIKSIPIGHLLLTDLLI